jgi:large subunit ribosomal protein L25
MSKTEVLKISKREGRGSQLASRLRKQGLVPGIIYGHKKANEQVSLVHEDLLTALRHNARVVDLQTDHGLQKAQIAELQWDHLGKDVLHVDFKRVSADERITVQVRVELRGTAPGIAAGGVLEQPLHAITIECLAIAVPDSIRVNVGELQLDGAVHVSDLVLPPDVKALDEPDAVVVHVVAPMAEPEPGEETGAVEPEVIGRQKEAEEEEEGK